MTSRGGGAGGEPAPRRPQAGLGRLADGLARLGLWLSGAGLVAMTAVIGWQIFARYVLNDTPQWSEQLSLLLMLYYVLFAAAVGVRDEVHIGVVAFRDALPPPWRRACDAANHLLVALFGLLMVVYGALMARATWGHVIPTLGVPTGTSYLPFPITGAAVALFAVENLLRVLAGERRPAGAAPEG